MAIVTNGEWHVRQDVETKMHKPAFTNPKMDPRVREDDDSREPERNL